MKDKKIIAITNAFQKALEKSDRKPNKKWIYKGSKIFNKKPHEIMIRRQ